MFGLFCFSALALSGCDGTVESLVDGVGRRNQLLKACADMGSDSLDDELCKLATKAQVEAAKRSIKDTFE
jgi:hypothetical protein